MYTKILRKLVKIIERVSGHCDGTENEKPKGVGHCY